MSFGSAAHARDGAPTAWPAPDASTGMRRPPLADRQCSRSGCAEGASVTLTYQYQQSKVWLDNLTPERDPHAYDMCARHAATLSVPSGWNVDDRRHGRHGALSAI